MKTKCPFCDYKATEHKTLEGFNLPEDEDISFCINCGEVSKFKINKLVKVDVRLLGKSERKELNEIRIAWLKTRAMQNLKSN